MLAEAEKLTRSSLAKFCIMLRLVERVWLFPRVENISMYDFYEEYWRPFGDLLVRMEFEGFLVDRKYLLVIKKLLSERLVMLLLLYMKCL